MAEVISCEPPQQMTLAWHPGKISEPTQTVIELTAGGGHHTHIRVTHIEGEAALGNAWDNRAALFNKGWNAVLTSIKTYLEQKWH